MSVAWVSSYPEQRRRAVSFATVLEPSNWLYAVKKLAYNRAVDDIDIFRSIRTGITCYEITSFISYNLEETEHQTLKRLFGETFLSENLSYSTEAKMGRYFKNFVRIQKSAQNATKDDPISEVDFYVLYDTIDQNIIINTASHTACHKDFMDVPNVNLDALVESVESCKIFNELGKKHYLEGGSWLCMPRYANDLDHAVTKCRRFYTHIVEEFINGCLREDFISRVSYSSVKTLVKVSNNKTVYFDYRESHPDKGPFHNEERIFRADREVRTVFLKLCKMRLSASLRYKPEVFTACKLNTRNTTSRLSLYSGIYHDRKLTIASE